MGASCRTSALRFLKIRPRAVEELKVKLEAKGFEEKDITETLKWLQDIQLLDDRAFTKSWIQYRLARPFGFMRIIRELKQKGVSDDIIQEAVASAREDYSSEETALEVAKRRWQRFSSIDPQKRKKRIHDFLLRRGFAPSDVLKVIKKLS